MQERGGLRVRVYAGLPQMPGDFGGHRRRAVRVENATELPEQVEDRQIGNDKAIGETVPFTIPQRLPAHAATEFRQQSRLAEARLAADANHLAGPAQHALQPCMQHGQLTLAADKAPPGTDAAPCHSGASPGNATDGVHWDGARKLFDLDSAACLA